MFTSLLRFECYYQSRQRALPLLALVFLAFGFLLGSQGYSPGQVNFNAPYQLALHTALVSLAAVFPVLFFSLSGVLRDQQSRFESLLYSTAIKKKAYFWSRYLGVLLFSLLAFSPFVIGLALGSLHPGLDPDNLAPFQIINYAWAACLFVFPNILICSAAVYTVGLISKNKIAVYATGIGIYALYWLCAIFLNSPLLAQAVPAAPENLAIAALLDPFGISAFFEQTQYWTAFEKNNQLVQLSGLFLANRLLWGTVTAGLLALGFRFFHFQIHDQKTKQKVQINEAPRMIKSYQRVMTALPSSHRWLRFRSLLSLSVKDVFRGLPFLIILGIWLVIVITEIYSRVYEGGHYGESLYPTTSLLIWLIEDPLPMLSIVLLIFYSGEIVWRERDLMLNDIIDACPVSNAIFFGAKFVALLALPFTLMLSSVLIAIGFQLIGGYSPLELDLYLAFFYYSGMPILFYAALALFIQTLSPKKYLGMFITGLVFIVFRPMIASQLGIHHPLFQLGHFPQVAYTNMNGYGDYSKPFHYFSTYWTLLGLLFIFLSFRLWRRGTADTLWASIRSMAHQWQRQHSLTIGLLIILFISSGGAIYDHTNIQVEYQTKEERLNFMEAYERKFKHLETPHRLFPVHVKTEVDLYPYRGGYHILAEHVVENKSDSSILQLFVSEREPLSRFEIRGARLVEYDSIFHTRLYRFHEPVLPGQQFRYTYELTKFKKGFESSRSIVNNGTYLMRNEYAPVLNYRRSLEIDDPFERKTRGLPVKGKQIVNETHLYEEEATFGKATFGKATFECIISTAHDQIAIAPGSLIREWKENERSFYHYRTSHPVLPVFNYFSAKYEVRKEKHRGISLEFYYHPGHDYNMDTIVSGTRQTLDYCIDNFCDYELDHLRIAEIPGHWNFGGQAMSGTISMVEDRFYLIDTRGPGAFDLVSKRTIHEVAHQWWGHMLSPKNIAGASLIIEGLAKYTEAVVMEKTHGIGAIRQLSETANLRYFRERSFAAEEEPPLIFSEGQGYLAYGKSFIAILATKELLGEERMNAALRTLLREHQDSLTATSLDFLQALKQVASPAASILIDDWFRQRITYDLAIEAATIEKLADGDYEITVALNAKRFNLNEQGQAISIAIDEPIQLGLFHTDPQSMNKGDVPIYMEPHRIQGESNLKIRVSEKPAYVVIDPLGTRLEERRADNRWAF